LHAVCDDRVLIMLLLSLGGYKLAFPSSPQLIFRHWRGLNRLASACLPFERKPFCA
jgi:hypothetical protein